MRCLYEACENCGYLSPRDVVSLVGTRDGRRIHGKNHLFVRNKWLLRRDVRLWAGSPNGGLPFSLLFCQGFRAFGLKGSGLGERSFAIPRLRGLGVGVKHQGFRLRL